MVRILFGIACLMLLWTFHTATRAQSKEPELPEDRRPRQVAGAGETLEDAKENAVKQAALAVTSLMRQQTPPMESFVVTQDYVRSHLVEKGRLGEDIVLNLPGMNKSFKQWILPFRTDHNWWKDIVYRNEQAERKARAEDRQTLASRGMLGLSILLLTGFGYVRLDEYTRRRYTSLLRVAGAAVVSVVVAVWWWALPI